MEPFKYLVQIPLNLKERQCLNLVKERFEFSSLSLGMPLYALTQVDSAAGARVLARRSVFVRAKQPLLVAEAFLPSFWSIARRAALQA